MEGLGVVMKSAVLVIDIVNDFVSGIFGSENSVAVSGKIATFLKKLEGKAEIVFTLDTHIPNDPEFKVWGEHCIMGTWGCQQVDSLKNILGYRITKRHFDAFHDTDLDGYLRALGIGTLYVFGISTDICVQHTVAGAFYRYYELNVISDLCGAISPDRHLEAISSMKRNYGARLLTSAEALEELKHGI